MFELQGELKLSPKQDEGFRGVSIKKELIDAVQKFIAANPDAGYKSLAELVSDAIRHRIEELKKIYVPEKA